MKIKAQVKRVCKINGATYEDIELTNEDIQMIMIRKCESLYSDNVGCTLNIETDLSIECG
tara:strand:+ start:373 stop:552 length:180 start_codon:yes stop_codon:yes gene_type:complete